VTDRARFACDPARSRGRLTPEPPSAWRNAFQRDRDRIIHSSAFRRLKHKTQVFVEHEGDYFRTRLTHSIEVAQVARTLAGVLDLDTDLAPWGGFDHNAQAIRIVTTLERHYAAFDGLNLTWEVLEGIAKHNGPVAPPLPAALADYDAVQDLELSTHAGAEAQVAAIADDIAYNHHDLMDGLFAGLFDDADLAELPLVGPCYGAVDAAWPGLAAGRRRHEALRRVFGAMVEDAIAESRARLAAAAPDSAAAVRRLGHPVIAFSAAMQARIAALRAFLFERMYRAPRVMAMRAEVTQVVRDLFAAFMADPGQLPADWQTEPGASQGQVARAVADYVAGMTDRFALQTHRRLCPGAARGVLPTRR